MTRCAKDAGHPIPRFARALGVAAAVLTLLAGCVAIPSSGGVNQGPPVQNGGNGSIVDAPLGPTANASKSEIFADFLQAATSSAANYEIAREFLTSKASNNWDPTASVLIREKPANPVDIGANSFAYTVSTKASVNALGVYSEQATDSDETLNYSFSKVKGQWRISDLPDGLVLSRDSFENSFNDYPIYFFDPEYHYLVPDVRWFPTGTTVPSRIVAALLAGPSDWLQGGAVSSPLAGIKAGSPVSVRNNTAIVDLSTDAASAKSVVLARIANQLNNSLDVTSLGISHVSITAHGAPLAVANPGLSTQRVAVAQNSPPLVQKGKQFGFSPRLESLGTISARIVSLNGSAIVLDHAQTAAAVLSRLGVYRVTPSTSKLVDSRTGLIAPSIDPSGYVWTVPANNAGAIIATGSDGAPHTISSTIPSDSTIVSLDVSRDGTRILVYLATSSGPRLIVAGIIRRAGVPISLGPLLDLPVSSATPLDATWVDPSTVAALNAASGEEAVTTYPIGGSPSGATTTDGAVHLVGAVDIDSLRIITSSGQIQQLRAGGWQDINATASILATQQ